MPKNRTIRCSDIEKSPESALTFCQDATKHLVVGTDTISSLTSTTASPSGLTIAGAGVIGATFTEPDTGNTVAANQGISFRASGGKLGDVFEIISLCTLSNGDTLALITNLYIR